MARLDLQNITKRFRGRPVLDDVTLSIEDGEFFVVYGPSGCGKSLLLKVVAGVLAPDQGRILMDGADVTHQPPERRGVAMTFQSYALYPHLTAFENIASPLRASNPRIGMQELEKRVRDVASLLRIEHVLDHRPAELSGGQKQRVALARSIVRPSRVLLLDDPLRNVDAKVRHQMRAELGALGRRLKRTVVYVTQDFHEALALGDRIAVLRGGRIQQVGTPREIFERPSSSFVARSFGEPPMNMLPARICSPPVTDGGGLVHVELDVGIWKAPVTFKRTEAWAGSDALRSGDVWVGVRPHELAVTSPSDGPPGQGWIGIDGHAVAFEPLGTKGVLIVRLSRLSALPGENGSVELACTVHREAVFAVGEPIRVWFPMSCLYLFGAEDGPALGMPAASA